MLRVKIAYSPTLQDRRYTHKVLIEGGNRPCGGSNLAPSGVSCLTDDPCSVPAYVRTLRSGPRRAIAHSWLRPADGSGTDMVGGCLEC